MYDTNSNVNPPQSVTKYTITFIGHNGAIIDQQEVDEGSAPSYPEAPAVEGYAFTGWDIPAIAHVMNDITVTALYSQNEEPPETTYSVRFWD